MNILGISAFYHDSAASLVRDGEIIAAAQEERFTRVKHDFSFPINAINYCLAEGQVKAQKLDLVAFYDKPLLKLERILQTYLEFAPLGLRSFVKAIPIWAKQKLRLRELIQKQLGYEGTIIFPEHHESHAAAAFFPSPYLEAAFLTIDGVGEWATTSYGVGKKNKITILSEMQFPHSLGLLYSAFTYYIGFRINSGEYKVMGLAPYGEPKYKEIILSELMDLKEDGSFKLNMKYFDYCVGCTMVNDSFESLFGGHPRIPDSEIRQRDMDLACSIQEVVEEVISRMTRHIYNETKQRDLCLAGGVALNCVANGRILREGPFENIWIQPAAGDAGGALGAALFTWYHYLGKPRPADGSKDMMKASYLGPEFSNQEILACLNQNNFTYSELPDSELIEKIADLIAEQKTLGWFQGRMEFGPRALGNRSIIGDARSPTMRENINLNIKLREEFRPFAPTVLKEKVSEFFDILVESPYMLLVAPVKEEIRKNMTPQEAGLRGLDKLRVVRSNIPAVTHVDYTARIQTIEFEDNPLYYRMIAKFEEKYGCPVIINTSFNIRGEPIVCSPEDALRCLMKSKMDYLVIGNYLIERKFQNYVDK